MKRIIACFVVLFVLAAATNEAKAGSTSREGLMLERKIRDNVCRRFQTSEQREWCSDCFDKYIDSAVECTEKSANHPQHLEYANLCHNELEAHVIDCVVDKVSASRGYR